MTPTVAGKPAESTDKTASGFRGGPDATTLTRPVRHGAVEVRRIEELPLHLAADARHGARADLTRTVLLQGMGDRLQERIPQVGIQRPGGGENGVELSVGQFDELHRGGASLL